jgi:hypothetical protein
VVTPQRFGFDGTEGALRYNFDVTALCGDPSAYVNWDGIHLTEAASHTTLQTAGSTAPTPTHQY